MWNSAAGVAVADHAGSRTASPACSRARRRWTTAYLRKPLSTWISPSTSSGSSPARCALVPDASAGTRCASRSSGLCRCGSRSLIAPSQRRYASARSDVAEQRLRRRAVGDRRPTAPLRTESASGSSTAARRPARAAAAGSTPAPAATRRAPRLRHGRGDRAHAGQSSEPFSDSRDALGQRHLVVARRRAGPGTRPCLP